MFPIPLVWCLTSIPCKSMGHMSIISSALQIIPPGMEFHHIVPHDGDIDGEIEGNDDHPTSPDPPIWAEVLIFPYSQYILIYPFLSSLKKNALNKVLKVRDYGPIQYPVVKLMPAQYLLFCRSCASLPILASL